MVRKTIPVVLLLCLVQLASAVEQKRAGDIAQHLQDISVTIKSGTSQGSGVIITREMQVSDADKTKRKVNFIWTAAHVIDNLRTTRTIVDSKGQQKTVVEFKPAHLVKELSEGGRKVGELKMEAVVVKYSDADTGEDLALLRIRKTDFVQASATFYLKDDMLLPIGEPLFHVGSLLGQDGANSMTSGILSQVGRVLELSGSNTPIFDQVACSAFPGSSGGAVYLANAGEHQGKVVGLLVRGAGETFNLIVPVRRIAKWCDDNGLRWAIDETAKMPTLEDIANIPVEDVGTFFDKRKTIKGDDDDESPQTPVELTADEPAVFTTRLHKDR